MSDSNNRNGNNLVNKLVGQAKTAGSEIASRLGDAVESDYESATAELKKNVAKGTTTALLVLSLLTGLAFSGPADINPDEAGTRISQTPIVMDIDDYVNTSVDDEDDADEQKGTKVGAVARFRQAVLSLPQSVRLLIITPLWAVGTALMTIVSFLWNVIFSSPLGAFIASFAVGFAVLFGLFAVTARMIFPDVPLKKLLSKKNILVLAIAAALLSVIDWLAPMYWHQYPAVAAAVKLAVGVFVIGTICYRIKKIFDKDKYQKMPAAAV